MIIPILPERRALVYQFCLAAGLGAIAFLLIACSCASKKSGPAVPAESTPTPVPADLTVAATLERNGQYEDAQAAYAAVVQEGDEEDKQEARIGTARVALQLNDAQTAMDAISAYKNEGGTGTQADFLLARAYAAQSSPDDTNAVDTYQKYIEEGGVASANAHSESAYLLISLGRVDEAEEQAELALDSLPLSLQGGIVVSVAQELESANETVEAAKWYQRLYDESDNDADKAYALEKIGILTAESDPAGAAADLVRVVTEYPATDAAFDVLQSGLAQVGPYSEGVVNYRHFQNDEAMQDFQAYLDANPDGDAAAAAHYYVAALDERLGDSESALQEYAASLSLDPTGPLSDDALWWSGLIYEKQSEWQQADDAYAQILAQSRDNTWSDDAAFRHGLVLYRQGLYLDAANAWRSFASVQSGETETHAFYWAAKAELANGDKAIAKSHLEDLATGWPLDYYGLRAAAVLNENKDKKATPLPGPETVDEDVRAWLTEATGQPSVSVLGVLLDPRWSKGRELLSVGFPRSGAAEFRDLMYEHTGDAQTLWSLAVTFHWIGQTELSARSAELALEALSSDQRGKAPRALLQMAYPEDYMSLLESAQSEEDVSPDVMLALIRQESFFDPLAGSSAGAAGLTQVIASTGESIATDLGVTDFVNDDLLRPVVNIRFGAYYLGQQFQDFGGNLYYALAAYNAGPGSAQTWRDAAGDDVDMFLEQVDVGEANLYVRLVMQNLAMYRYLYEGAERPSLP